MKCKKTISLLLVAVIALGMLSGCGNNQPSSGESTGPIVGESAEPVTTAMYDDAELARAVELGIGQYREFDTAVSYADFLEILDKVIELSSDTVLAWEGIFQNARKSNRTMTRREGMVAVYFAAESLGENYYQYNNTATGTQIFEEIASVDEWLFWDEMWDCDYSLFPNVEAMPLNGEGSYVNAGYFYSMNRASLSNGQTIFDYDSNTNSMRPADPFTYTEALRAAIRLYDSYHAIEPRPMTAADEEIIANADVRRETILNSPTEITVTGTSYFVSANGDDNNDGKSEKTPWASLEKVNSAKLQPGDGVFFRRGMSGVAKLSLPKMALHTPHMTREPSPVFTVLRKTVPLPKNGAYWQERIISGFSIKTSWTAVILFLMGIWTSQIKRLFGGQAVSM